MTKSFKGKIAVDIRDSTPDWEPYLSPQARGGAPNVLVLAWDDVGYGTMEVFGDRSIRRACGASRTAV